MSQAEQLDDWVVPLAAPVMISDRLPRPAGPRVFVLACVERGCGQTFRGYVEDFEDLEQQAQDAGWTVLEDYLCPRHRPAVCGTCLEPECRCAGDW